MSTTFEFFAHTPEASGKSPKTFTPLQQSVDEHESTSDAVEHTTLDADLEAVQVWVQEARTRSLKLRNISLEQARDLETKLRRAGRKVRQGRVPTRSDLLFTVSTRYDWSASDRTAVFRMPTMIHNCPGTWLSMCVPQLQEALRKVARCGEPVLLGHGDSNVKVGSGAEAKAMQPDGGIDVVLYFRDSGEERRYHPPYPRIVLETCYSQPVREAEDKAWHYLWNSDGHTQAVIIVDMSYPVRREKDFKASLAVWTRQETGDDDLDYPCEEIGGFKHRLRPLPAESTTNEDPAEPQQGSDECGSPTSTYVSGDTTKGDILPPVTKPGPGGDESRKIQTPGYTVNGLPRDQVVLDEADATSLEQFALVFDVFRLLRRCPEHPSESPIPCELELPLAPLRSRMLASLSLHRDAEWPIKRKAEADQTVAVPADPSATRSAPLPLFQAWRQQKKAKHS
ncbi:hypothetical protein FRC10_001431 [Ceratobasidium sp. 414]|nr:hypothetical protein FRC10_001431 [Ceratobasidium sp. 414]